MSSPKQHLLSGENLGGIGKPLLQVEVLLSESKPVFIANESLLGERIQHDLFHHYAFHKIKTEGWGYINKDFSLLSIPVQFSVMLRRWGFSGFFSFFFLVYLHCNLKL